MQRLRSNSPCWCGSGGKFKRCHGDRRQLQRPPVPLGEVGAETRAVLTVIGEILDELQLDRANMVKVEVHLSDLGDFDAMDAAYREFFEEGAFPARTTTESRHLFGDSKVEITCQVLR